MNKLLIAFCLALTVGACASTPSASPAPVAATTIPGTVGKCVPVSPSSPQTDCQNVDASVYTKQQWQQLGATNTAEALRLVAPSVSVR
jgi:hypothetical protein